MDVQNDRENRKIIIEASYAETHYLAEALFNYQLVMESEYGKNSEEEKYIGELLHAVRNPTIQGE